MLNRREVVSVVVYGELPERSLREQAEQIRDELLLLPGITQVDLDGVRPYEISVDIPEQQLRGYGLTLEQVAGRIRQASLDLPGGTIKTAGGEVLVRTKERRYTGREYADIVILTTPGGTEVALNDIAVIRDGFGETDQFATFAGQPAAMVKVYRVGDQKPTEIAADVKAFVAQKQHRLPDSVHLDLFKDDSELFQSRKNLLIKNALIGLVLVFFMLGLFLEIRLALWVMLGIPISFCGALLFMPAMDVSINMISLFAFIMALGIVVGENIHEQRQAGLPYLQAAISGAVEVAQPVTFAILLVAGLGLVGSGIVGAVLGHFVMGFDLSMLSVFGIVALAGGVVNDSLLLIDYVNRHRRKGVLMFDAIMAAGQRRFRPILLTSLTTFFGLMPMILKTSVQAHFLIPMAISLAFGIMFATAITLLLIPSLYLVLEDVRRWFGLRASHAHRGEEG